MVTFSLVSNSQSIQVPKEIKSPNASSLGKFGDIPISYYTGRANVSVPVYSIVKDGVPLDISLSYDTGGVRVNEHPSWVGQNWSLNAGGVITRTVKGGLEDEYFDNYWSTQNPVQGYYYCRTALQSSTWSSTTNLKNIALIPQKGDYEPDLFSFNFMGFSGKFFLDVDGKWAVQSNQNLKVEINFNDNVYKLNRNILYFREGRPQANWLKCIGKIKITDENGNTYIFGGNQKAMEYSQTDFFNFYGAVVANAWYLTEVKNRHGDLLYSFTYDRGDYDYQAHFYPSYTSKTISMFGTYPHLFTPTFGCSYSTSSPDQGLVAGTLTIPTYLTKIVIQNSPNNIQLDFEKSLSNYKSFSNATTDNLLLPNTFQHWKDAHGCNGAGCNGYILENFYLFFHNPNEQIINNEYVTELGNFLIGKLKNFKLDNISINYGNSLQTKVILNRNNSTTERLNLLGVSFNNSANNKISSYRFQYNNFNLLPSLLSKKTDHWGFYNGVDYNLNSPNIFTNFYNLKEPNSTFMSYGSLNKIIYPTGGYTEFEYEPHNYSQYVDSDLNLQNESKIAGGLRIKKIMNFDGSKLITKEIKYTAGINSTTSSGILNLKNVYYVPNWTLPATDYNATYNESCFSLNNLLPGSNFSGSHIGYSKVFEIESGNGYKEYQYTDYVDYPDIPYVNTISISHSIFDEHIRNDFKRGLEKKVSYYINSSLPLREEISSYASVGSFKARGFNYDQFNPCPDSQGNGVLLGNAYEIEFSDFRLSQKQNIDYFGSSSIATVTNFAYVNYPNNSSFFGNSFIKTESTNIDGVDNTSTLNYPFDFSSSAENSMTSQHFFPVVEKVFTKNGAAILKEKTNFGYVGLLGATYALPLSSQKAKGTNTYEQDIIIDSYDVKGNITEFHKLYGASTSLFWEGDKLITKVVGATQSQISSIGLTNLNNTSNIQITNYTYNNLDQLTQIKQPNGNMENYIYDINNRLEKVTDRNGKVLKKYEYNLVH